MTQEEEWDYEIEDDLEDEAASNELADEFANMALGEVTLGFARDRLFASDGLVEQDESSQCGALPSAGAAEGDSAESVEAREALSSGIDELEQDERVFDAESVDIVEIERMRKILDRSPSFSRLVFSADEQEYCEKSASPETHYALRFAAKEAVVKALGTGFSEGIGVLDIEVRRNAKGRPFVVLRGAAKDIAKKRGVRDIPLSLSYTHTEAVACAMAITESSKKASEERIDPMEELTRKFKETRSMLDDL